jgi:multisubunit Na+/H+ antiporter MnhB subunit
MVDPPRKMARVELGFAIAAAIVTLLDPGLVVPAFAVTAIALGMALGTASCVRNLQRIGAQLIPVSKEQE